MDVFNKRYRDLLRSFTPNFPHETKQSTYLNIAEEIKKCKDHGQNFLNLSNQNLTKIPLEIFELKELKFLNFRYPYIAPRLNSHHNLKNIITSLR
jgi:hypothetical protein